MDNLYQAIKLLIGIISTVQCNELFAQMVNHHCRAGNRHWLPPIELKCKMGQPFLFLKGVCLNLTSPPPPPSHKPSSWGQEACLHKRFPRPRSGVHRPGQSTTCSPSPDRKHHQAEAVQGAQPKTQTPQEGRQGSSGRREGGHRTGPRANRKR